MLYVVTEHDSVYAFDADSGTQLWKVSTLGSGETTSDDHGCGQVTPEIGITSTPVIDRTKGVNGTIFVVAMSKDSKGAYHQRLHALDVTTGAETTGSPTEIAGTYPGTGDNSSGGNVVFAPGQYAGAGGAATDELDNLSRVDVALRCAAVYGMGDGVMHIDLTSITLEYM